MGISIKEGKEAALGQAAKCGDLSLVNYFLALNADPNIWDEHHIFPLHWAVQSGDVRICEVLIKAGADVNARTDVWNRVGGHTPLHYCNIPSANLSVIKLMLDHGADPNLRCRSFPSSHTALQNLILRGRPIVAFEVIDLLGDRARFSKLQANPQRESAFTPLGIILHLFLQITITILLRGFNSPVQHFV